jgi:hypothetical protein
MTRPSHSSFYQLTNIGKYFTPWRLLLRSFLKYLLISATSH